MKPPRWLWLSAMLLVVSGIGSARGQDRTRDDPAPPERLMIPARFKLGDVGEPVREIQATLNAKLAGAIIELPASSRVGPRQGVGRNPGQAPSPGEQIRQFLLDDGRSDLRIRGSWVPCKGKRDPTPIPEADLDPPQPYGVKKYLLLPDLDRGKTPLLVDGVFGQHTHSGVIMFQLQMNLQPTGEVDAVTLDKLEPMIPSNWLLASVMRWVEQRGFYDPTQEDYPSRVKWTTAGIVTAIILLAAALVYYAARNLAHAPERLAKWYFEPRNSAWFRALVEKKVFARATQFVPALFICLAAVGIFPAPDTRADDPFPYLAIFQQSHDILSRAGLASMAWVAMVVGLAYVNACDFVFTGGGEEDNAVKRIARTAKRLVVLVGAVLIGSALAGRNPMFFVGGLGALMAVIMLVFRGAILGLVASVQIVANKMVRIGDWIEVPSHDANGHVREMSLTTVKVRNFDRSISMIPMSNLLSESFHNWSEMQRAGGRRIKRSLYIDIQSIRACTPEMIGQFEKIELLRDYLRKKQRSIERDNESRDTESSPVNSRRLTNIGTFRAYLEAYLASHPRLRTDLIHVVRQLQPCEHGLPIEISIFCRDTDWANYEAVQADIFDHILSIIPEFHLRAFQEIRNT